MWKLLPLCLLASCAVSEPSSDSAGASSDQGRIVRQIELPAESTAQSTGGQSSRKTFNIQGTQGWLEADGAWHISTEVHHGRLRCATYEAGIQLGRGNPACTGAEWLTGTEYSTRLRHCNSATRIHAGSGTFPGMANRLEEVTCVRVLVRCEGTC